MTAAVHPRKRIKPSAIRSIPGAFIHYGSCAGPFQTVKARTMQANGRTYVEHDGNWRPVHVSAGRVNKPDGRFIILPDGEHARVQFETEN